MTLIKTTSAIGLSVCGVLWASDPAPRSTSPSHDATRVEFGETARTADPDTPSAARHHRPYGLSEAHADAVARIRREIELSGDYDIARASDIVLRANEAQGAFFNNEVKLTAGDAAPEDQFGYSVAISGDTAVVGATYNDDDGSNSGSAYIFGRNVGGADNWGEVTKLTASDAGVENQFGYAVAISGDTAIVGAWLGSNPGGISGAAYIFQRNNGGANNWGEVIKLTGGLATTGGDFGISVSIDGDTAVVGASRDNEAANAAGSAYVFQRNEGGVDNWGQVGKLTAGDAAPDDAFGWSVTISGNTVVVGAPQKDDEAMNAGAAYVFRRDEGGVDNWGQQVRLMRSDPTAGDAFGISVSIFADTAIIGAALDDAPASGSGSAYIFQRNEGGASNWGEVTKLTASDGAQIDFFGWSVSISGDTAFVGAQFSDSGAGSAYLYERDSGGADNWGETLKLLPCDAAPSSNFGWSTSIDGGTVIVGARVDDAAGFHAGSAHVFFSGGSACCTDAQCNDGLWCTGVESCVAGTCQAGAPPCDDGVGCTTDNCDEVAQSCDSVPDDNFCDDGQFCNGPETCDPSADCQPGSDPCPGQACDEINQLCFDCTNDSDCDDGDFCTGVETCLDGVCLDGSFPCTNPNLPFCDVDLQACVVCLIDDHCPDDQNACTRDFCEAGECKHRQDILCFPGTQCDPVDGQCKECLSSEDCPTAQSCLLPEGVCGGCVTDADCDDGNPCTDDTCAAAVCTSSDNSGPCNDGLFCNGQDSCADGTCSQHAGSACSEGQFCLEEFQLCLCETDAGCDDGNACNGTEACDVETGECLPGTPVDCDDGDDCNGLETCDSQTGKCATGTITDCNGNKIDDLCDLDRCVDDPACDDCDKNGVPDACDIAAGEPDVNGNGVPDRCDPPCSDNASCADLDSCTFDRCIDGLCSRESGIRYGDLVGEGGSCGPDGDVSLPDILAVLDGFEGRFNDGCEFANVNIAGSAGSCIPDDLIDLNDILAVLDAFQGLDHCCAGGR